MDNYYRLIDEAKVSNKVVLLRSDLDVEVDNDTITGNNKIVKAAHTVKSLIDNKAKVVILSHRGNPGGEYADELSLIPVRFELGRILEKSIKFANIDNCINSIKFMEPGDVLLLENIRFSKEEMSLDSLERKELINKFGGLVDFYINDSLGLTEKYASNYELAQEVDSYAGKALIADLESIINVKNTNKQDSLAIIAAEDLNENSNLLQYVANNFSKLYIGGSLSLIFLIADNKIKNTFGFDNKAIEIAKNIIKTSKAEIILPIDFFIGEVSTKAEELTTLPDSIGTQSFENIEQLIPNAKLILINNCLCIHNDNAINKKICQLIINEAKNAELKMFIGKHLDKLLSENEIKLKKNSHFLSNEDIILDILNDKISEPLELLRK